MLCSKFYIWKTATEPPSVETTRGAPREINRLSTANLVINGISQKFSHFYSEFSLVQDWFWQKSNPVFIKTCNLRKRSLFELASTLPRVEKFEWINLNHQFYCLCLKCLVLKITTESPYPLDVWLSFVLLCYLIGSTCHFCETNLKVALNNASLELQQLDFHSSILFQKRNPIASLVSGQCCSNKFSALQNFLHMLWLHNSNKFYESFRCT